MLQVHTFLPAFYFVNKAKPKPSGENSGPSTPDTSISDQDTTSCSIRDPRFFLANNSNLEQYYQQECDVRGIPLHSRAIRPANGSVRGIARIHKPICQKEEPGRLSHGNRKLYLRNFPHKQNNNQPEYHYGYERPSYCNQVHYIKHFQHCMYLSWLIQLHKFYRQSDLFCH